MLKPLEKSGRASKNRRCIGKLEGTTKGPTVVFFGGIHGNEPAGVKALEHVFSYLRDVPLEISGSIYGIRGNIPALLQKKRFIDADLNRLWTETQITKIENKPHATLGLEEMELLDIKQTLTTLLKEQPPPFYFIDFHTTSSKTLPFITINDALINRKFSQQFPVPIILGIEEYLEGPLLSLMNQSGYVSLGFESGQHDEQVSITNSIAFFWLSLVFAGVLQKEAVPDFNRQYKQLSMSAQHNSTFYEVDYRHVLPPYTDFAMLPGFESFQKVEKGTLLARQNEREVRAEKNTMLFMPLYQKQGAEGFFLINEISKWALGWSIALRKIKFDRLLVCLPGISWESPKKEALLVNLSVARFFAKSFFHLLGYRSQQKDKAKVLMYNRELTAKNELYRNEAWY